MVGWISTKVATPNAEIECVVAQRNTDAIDVYKKFVEYDGERWVDIDGEEVPGVIAWRKAPEYDLEVETILSKIAGCAANMDCKESGCGYYVAADLLEKLTKIID